MLNHLAGLLRRRRVLSYAGPRDVWLSAPDGGAFARSVHAIVRYPQDRERRIAEALRTAAKYSWPIVADRFLDLYAYLHSRLHGSAARTPVLEPAFVSTPGNRWGVEPGPVTR
jgi:hypothetical protein